MAENNMSRRIKELRTERGMTLEQVALIVGVGKSTVRKWETGMIANMKRDKIAALAQALGTTPADLMGWDDTKKSSPDKLELTEGEKVWLELYHQVSQETREVLINVANKFDKLPTDTQDFLLGAIRVALNNQK